MNPDIWDDVSAITGEPDQLDFVIQGPNYRIRTRDLLILGSNPQTVDCGKNVPERGLCH